MMLRHFRTLAILPLIASLTACAGLSAPSPERLAALPVVTYPDAPPAGDFVYKLPAGKAIASRVAIQGSALASQAEQTLHVTLPRDLYVHRRWVSEDGKTWQPVADVFDIRLTLSLPSDEHPKPGELQLTVDRKGGH